MISGFAEHERTPHMMKKHITGRTVRGLVLFALVLLLITLGLQIGLRQALHTYQTAAVQETGAPSETREPLPVTMLPSEDNAEESGDLLQHFTDAFSELDLLEENLAGERQGSRLKEEYTSLAKLWNQQLEDLGECITENMSEEEAESYIADANAFLVSRNHECIKELGQDKLSVAESTDYLRREVTLTKERCRQLLKDYHSRLAS